MKDIPINRKLKEELSAHFSSGGTVNNVKGELARVSMVSRLQCHEFWKRRVQEKPITNKQAAREHCAIYQCPGPGRDHCPITGNCHCPS